MDALKGLLAFAVFSISPIAYADEAGLSFGGDQFAAGEVTSISSAVQNDAFAAGRDVNLSAAVSGDAHLAGYAVEVPGNVTGDVYAVGYSIRLTGSIGGDVTAAGESVTVRSDRPVGGNARLAGATITLAAPVQGSALITARTLELSAPIRGDLTFYGENLSFGDGAVVGGSVWIHGPKEIAVPASVASAERVHFVLADPPDYASEAGRTAGDFLGRLWPLFWMIATWWVLLLIAGAGFIVLFPRSLSAWQVASERRPFRNLGLGILAMAAALGLVPVTAMTVVGIVLLPLVVLAAFIACSLAYVVGLLLIGLRLAGGLVAIDTNPKRLGVLATSLVIAGLLGTIPLLGWLITLGIVMFGFGIVAVVTLGRWSGSEGHSSFPDVRGSVVV